MPVLKIDLSFLGESWEGTNAFQYLCHYFCALCVCERVEEFIDEFDPQIHDAATVGHAIEAHLRRTLRRVATPEGSRCHACQHLLTET